MRANTATNVTQLNQGVSAAGEEEWPGVGTVGGGRWAAGNTGLLGRKWAFYPVSLGTALQLGEGGTLSFIIVRFFVSKKENQRW